MATQNLLMARSFSVKFMMVFALVFGVSACQSASVSKTGVSASATVSEDTSAEPVDTGPRYVEGLGYRMTWTKTDASLVTAPQEIKDEALAICQEKGYVRSYMRQIAFSTDEAEAYFDCTGANSN